MIVYCPNFHANNLFFFLVVGKYYNQIETPDPQLAAVKLVEEGIKRWQQEDDSIDDTTAIVVFLASS